MIILLSVDQKQSQEGESDDKKATQKPQPTVRKSRVAPANLKGDKMIAELAARSGEHTNQITEWKKRLCRKMPQLCSDKNEKGKGAGISRGCGPK